ncbi:sortase B [Lachnospiraceae bacterium PM6-15]|uniref:class B sortase n=1 Tax=Ohessyouella blattaphilus TaxID=2949333 RepID=UPI003E1FA9A0
MSKFRKVMIGFLLIIALVCGSYSAYYFVKRAQVGKVYEVLAEDAKIVAPLVIEEQAEEKEPIPIDFEKLWEINPEIYAWIQIPGTTIDFPIVQSATDNNYYLNHSIEYQEGLPGSIFTENRNNREFSDYNTIIYGHNMMDGSMFSPLHDFRDAEFFSTHSEIIIYTPEKKIVYEIFAAVGYTNENLLDKYDFSAADMRQSFIDSLQDERIAKGTVNYGEKELIDKQLITLSTCDDTQGARRYLVVAAQKD